MCFNTSECSNDNETNIVTLQKYFNHIFMISGVLITMYAEAIYIFTLVAGIQEVKAIFVLKKYHVS